MKSQDKALIRGLAKLLNSVGGVMDEKTYRDLVYETVTETNLRRVDASKLLSLHLDMEKMGYLKKVSDGENGLWTLTLEGFELSKTPM